MKKLDIELPDAGSKSIKKGYRSRASSLLKAANTSLVGEDETFVVDDYID